MKRFYACILFSIIACISNSTLAAIFQTDWLPVQEIDSLSVEGAYITLVGYVNPTCDENRIYVKDDDLVNYREMIAILLSAIHTGKDVRLQVNDSSGVCLSDRVMIRK